MANYLNIEDILKWCYRIVEEELKTREPLTTRQRSILTTFYDQNPYPSASERRQLVQLTGRTPKQIQDWFANRRRTDPKFISAKSVSVSQPPPSSTTIETNYYYNLPPPPPPPPISPMCPCCGLTQSMPCIDQPFPPMFYPPINYYSFSNNFQS